MQHVKVSSLDSIIPIYHPSITKQDTTVLYVERGNYRTQTYLSSIQHKNLTPIRTALHLEAMPIPLEVDCMKF
jgi:hypothetical protein